MARICAAIRPVFTGKGLLFWPLFCALAVFSDRGHAASFAPGQSPLAGYSSTASLLRVHGSHCEWRVGRDARVGYAHNHRHVEACENSSGSDQPLENFDRHDKRTSTHKTAGERDQERRRAPSADQRKADENKSDGRNADDRKPDDRKSDDRKRDGRTADERRLDDKEAAVSPSPRLYERRERSRCNAKPKDQRGECSDGPPPPPFRSDPGEGPADDEPDGLTKARCGMLCMWRRAKYGHCGVGCSYYRRRYENDGYGDWRRHHNRDEYSDGADPDLLK